MKASITVELIDQVTAKAKQISSALKDINKAAGNQAKEAAKAATGKVEQATKAAKEAARDAQKAAKDAAQAPAKEAVARAKEAAKAPRKAMVPDRPALDYLRKSGDAPPPSGKGGKKLGFADLGNLPGEADKAAGQSVGLLGNAVASAKAKVATAISQELGGQLSGIATDFIAEKVQGALDPVREQLGAVKEQFPAFAPLIDNLSNNLEGMTGLAAGVLGEIGGRMAGVAATRIGMLAGGLISLPGAALIGTVAIMARWSQVKEFMVNLFAKLPAPAQAAMSKIGAALAATPLGAAARGFDAFAGTVQSAFNIMTSDATDKWSQLKALLVDNPLSAMSGAWDGVKSYLSNLFSDIAKNPREAFAGLANTVLNAFKSIPSGLANVGIAIIEAITGADLSRVNEKVQEIINAFFDIPKNMIALGGEIARQIAQGDFAGAARTAAEGFASGLRNILGLIGDLGSEIVASFKNINLVSAGLAMIQSLWEGMLQGLNMLAERVSTKLAEIKASISRGLGGVGPGPANAGAIVGKAAGNALGARAKGGPVSAGTPYMVGEEGQELFVPDTNGRIIDATQTRRLLSPIGLPPASPMPSLYGSEGGGGTMVRASIDGGRSTSTSMTNTFHLTVQGAPTDDPEEFGRKLWAEMERKMRGMMHDGVST